VIREVGEDSSSALEYAARRTRPTRASRLVCADKLVDGVVTGGSAFSKGQVASVYDATLPSTEPPERHQSCLRNYWPSQLLENDV
jgi:hypothetical protein